MKLLKRLPIYVGVAFSLTLTASPAFAIVNQNGLATNALSMNALSMNALSMNALSMNALSMNALSMNALSMNSLSANAVNGGNVSHRHEARDAGDEFALRDALRQLGSHRLVADSKN